MRSTTLGSAYRVLVRHRPLAAVGANLGARLVAASRSVPVLHSKLLRNPS